MILQFFQTTIIILWVQIFRVLVINSIGTASTFEAVSDQLTTTVYTFIPLLEPSSPMHLEHIHLANKIQFYQSLARLSLSILLSHQFFQYSISVNQVV